MAAGKSVLTGGERASRWFRRAETAKNQERDGGGDVVAPAAEGAAVESAMDVAAEVVEDAAGQWQREDLLAWLAEYEAQNAMLRRELTASRTAAPVLPPCTHTWEASDEGREAASTIEAMRTELEGQRSRAAEQAAEQERLVAELAALATRHDTDTARSAGAHAAAADEVRALRARLAAAEEATSEQVTRLTGALDAARADAAAAKERHRKALERGRQQKARADEQKAKADALLAAARRHAEERTAAHAQELEAAQARIRELEAAAGAARVAAASRRPALAVVPGQHPRPSGSSAHPAGRSSHVQGSAAR